MRMKEGQPVCMLGSAVLPLQQSHARFSVWSTSKWCEDLKHTHPELKGLRTQHRWCMVCMGARHVHLRRDELAVRHRMGPCGLHLSRSGNVHHSGWQLPWCSAGCNAGEMCRALALKSTISFGARRAAPVLTIAGNGLDQLS